MADIRIKLTKSLIGSKPNNAATQGKIKKIAHLITVVEE